MIYKIKNIIVPGRADTAGRDNGPSTARLSCRGRPGTIKRVVVRAGPSSTAHLAIYTWRYRISLACMTGQSISREGEEEVGNECLTPGKNVTRSYLAERPGASPLS
jgi:hypothetical protein